MKSLLIFLSVALVACDQKQETISAKPAEIKIKTEKTVAVEGITSNQFDLFHELSGENLEITLNSDLPNDTIISITVSRSYWEKGSETEYARSYSEFKGKLSDVTGGLNVDVSPKIWKDSLDSHQKMVAKAGLGFKVGKIGKEIEISAVVPINGQSNPKFGPRNINLSGSAVTVESYGRLVKSEVRFDFPL